MMQLQAPLRPPSVCDSCTPSLAADDETFVRLATSVERTQHVVGDSAGATRVHTLILAGL
eukprot:2614450-Amphidinium_carterae.2